MKHFILIIAFISFGLFHASLNAQLQSPDQFLPHKLGEHFTPHHMLVDYFEHVAEESPLVKLIQYGTTNQHRPLLVAIVTSEENHRRLEEIRTNNLKMTGLVDGDVDPSISKVITWLSYSVHGNEAAGSESSRQVLYELVDPNNIRTKQWLENSVVILDPSINPDGYSRYTHWVRNVTMDENNADRQDIEHNEPWPGGRVNHYLFDLNRDWAWQTQVESQQRIELYNMWLPHVHADLHEMGHESPYYFAPAAKPYHKYITQFQRDFQTDIGKNHAKYFDQEGWLYFTKEVFDLFYPSYGDTYPTFSGGIGMTYEQGGSSVGGRGVKLRNGEVLTLKDRIDHHITTSLSTVEITSQNADRVLQKFQEFYDKTSKTPPGKYKTFAIKKDNSGRRIAALADLLSKQDIRFGTVDKTRTLSGYHYNSGMEGSLGVEPGDLVVSAYQPKALLAQVLLEPAHQLEDSLTYDITAWSLPYAYGLDAIASTSRMDVSSNWNETTVKKEPTSGYAYLIPRTDLESVKLISRLLAEDISLRVLPKEVQYEGQKFAAGTVVITHADNQKIKSELLTKIRNLQKDNNADVITIKSGFAEVGHDLGSRKIRLIEKPKVLSIMGEGVSSLSFGQIKWYFDRVIDYQLSVVDIHRFSRIDLDQYNTLVLPEGRYSLSKGDKSKIAQWVKEGGKLIAISSATRNFIDTDGFGLKKYATDDDKTDAEKENKNADLAARYNHYSDRERNSISNNVPGAIFELEVDETHPMAFGLGDKYHSLRTNSTTFPLMVGAANVIYHPKENGKVQGFAGAKIRKRLNDSAVVIVESKGRGEIIYMADNPLFRGFWYNGLFLFSNALFL